MSDELLSVCELAARLGRSERYVRAMRAQGFEMPGGRATLREARDFLRACAHPCGGREVETCAGAEVDELATS